MSERTPLVRTGDVSDGEGFLEPALRGALWRRAFVASVGDGLGAEDGGRALATAAHLWPAWCSLPTWENVIDHELGSSLDMLIPVLWGMRRSGSVDGTSERSSSGAIDQGAWPAPGSESDDNIARELVSDLVRTSFALGAAWAASRGDRGSHGNAQTT